MTKRCISVGYGSSTKGYQLHDPIKKKIIHARDVIFNENKNGFESF